MTLSKQAQHERLIADLKASKEQFEKRGWLKGALITPQGVCALGAIGCVTIPGFQNNLSAPYHRIKSSKRAMAVIEAVGRHIPDDDEDYEVDDKLVNFNDAEDSTMEDVIAFFDKALAEAGGLA